MEAVNRRISFKRYTSKLERQTPIGITINSVLDTRVPVGKKWLSPQYSWWCAFEKSSGAACPYTLALYIKCNEIMLKFVKNRPKTYKLHVCEVAY